MKRSFELRRNVDSGSADVTSSGRSFQICWPTSGKAQLPTVDSLTGGTTRRLVPTERRTTARQVGDASERSKVLRLSAGDCGGDMSAWHHSSTCPLAWRMDGRIMHCRTNSSRHSSLDCWRRVISHVVSALANVQANSASSPPPIIYCWTVASLH